MRGRAQAYAVAFLGNFLPFVSPATVGLVTLRKGGSEGLLVMLWAALPLVASYYFAQGNEVSQGNGLLTFVSLLSLVMMVIAANVLRLTRSWQWTILLSMLAAGAVAQTTGLLLVAEIDRVIAQLSDMMAEIAASQSAEQAPLAPSRSMVLGAIALMLSMTVIVSLFVSRWWQALLYNPGGFREEFHSLRLDSLVAGILLLTLIAGLMLPNDFRFWAELMAVPLVVAGISLAHWGANRFSLGTPWLVFMYIGLVISAPVIGGLLVALGFADSLLNLRLRFAESDREQ
jgi:hypothetical protein